MIERVKELLLDKGINPASTVEYDVNGSLHVMSLQEIAEQFMRASPESQEIFVIALQKALQEGKSGVQNYFEKMGELLLMSSLSEKF
ncbi:MAG: hypothetical protein U9N52_11400 [Campylobacterota bacterium]|nr:hypothetical protein [Campylobacterota bacterium]